MARHPRNANEGSGKAPDTASGHDRGRRAGDGVVLRQTAKRFRGRGPWLSSIRRLKGAAGLAGGCLLGAPTWAAGNPPDLASNPAPARGELDTTLPAIFVAGDSTAAKGKGASQEGWGAVLPGFFDPERVRVVNRARGGRSSRTFVTEGLWAALLADLKAGDVVLLQFGHNDGGAINEEPPGSTRPTRARGSLPGLGEESVPIDNIVTGKRETVYTFGHYMRRMIADVQDAGATPVVLSLTLRDLWEAGRIERGSGQYGGWSRAVAEEADVPFIDITHPLADRFEAMGPEAVKAYFEQDYVHFNQAGAEAHAEAVVAGLKGLRALDISPWLSARGEGVEPDTLAWLNLPIPIDRSLPSVFLIGDSTVRNGRGDGANGEWGWGAFLPGHFDLARVNVVNRAVGGLSSRTYLTQGHWARVRAMLRPGDFVVIQFGHNDDSPLNDELRARGTIPGTGAEAETIMNLLTGKEEVVRTYGAYLRQFLAEARERGATPLLCSPVPRKRWDNRAIVRPEESYADWARAVAQAEEVAFLDLARLIADHYEALGPAKVEWLFADAHTHTNAAGAVLNAASVVEALRRLGDHPLEAFLR
jgi:lysophospholipase L1-like esterase